MSQYPPQPSYEIPARQPSSGMAVASLVLGIISLFFCFWYIAIPCGILAIVFGVIAGGKAKTGQGGGAGMARAGLIMGCIGLVLDVVAVVLIFTIGITFLKAFQSQMQQQQLRQQQRHQQLPINPSPATSPSASGSRGWQLVVR